MSVLWVLIGFSAVLAIVAGATYCWANASGQYDDLNSPGARLVFEDLEEELTSKEKHPCNQPM